MAIPLYSIWVVSNYEGLVQNVFQTLDKGLAEEVLGVLDEHVKKYPSTAGDISEEVILKSMELDNQISAYLGCPNTSFYTMASFEEFRIVETEIKSRSSIGTKPL